MWTPKELGEEIATRSLTLRVGVEEHVVTLRIGRPVRGPAPEEDYPWFCTIQFVGLGAEEKIHAIAGHDSLQAIVLALDFARKMAPHFAEQAGGNLEWDANEHDIISPQRSLLEAYSTAAAEALEGVRLAEVALRGREGSNFQSVHSHLAQLVEKYGKT